MFTGIVETVGTVTELSPTAAGDVRISIEAPSITPDLAVGASVAVNGACLTAVGADDRCFEAEAVVETLRRTTLGRLGPGARVNLERAMPANGRFDGHIVQGHVDGVGRVVAVHPEGDGRRAVIEAPPELEPYLVDKGAITVDGVSLTIAGVSGPSFEVALIPHTLGVTTLGDWTHGAEVNLEADILAKYLRKLVGR